MCVVVRERVVAVYRPVVVVCASWGQPRELVELVVACASKDLAEVLVVMWAFVEAAQAARTATRV